MAFTAKKVFDKRRRQRSEIVKLKLSRLKVICVTHTGRDSLARAQGKVDVAFKPA